VFSDDQICQTRWQGGLVMQKEDFVDIIKNNLISEKDPLDMRYAQARVNFIVLPLLQENIFRIDSQCPN